MAECRSRVLSQRAAAKDLPDGAGLVPGPIRGGELAERKNSARKVRDLKACKSKSIKTLLG